MNSSHIGTVVSSHGTARFDLTTGDVFDYTVDVGGDPSTFSDIKRFDIAEYRTFYGPEAINHKGERVSVSIDDIYEKAREAFGVKPTLATY